MTTEKAEPGMPDDNSLETRVRQFERMELPGQPPMMHMGTAYLVSDLWKEVTKLRAGIEATRAAPPRCDAQSEALKKAEQTIGDAWNAFGAHLAEDMVDAENLAIIGDGDLAEQITTLVRQRDAAEASIRALFPGKKPAQGDAT